LGEPRSVATTWKQIGNVHQRAKQLEAAENAYHKSLAISVTLRDVGGQAQILNDLGNLYSDRGSLDEAAATFQKAANAFATSDNARREGEVRANMAGVLRRLSRLDEARQEIQRAIESTMPFGHAAAPWKAWAILADIEADVGDASAAERARANAIAYYLAYRQAGGENHFGDGRLSLAVSMKLIAGDEAGAASLLQEVAAQSNPPSWVSPFIAALQAIVSGSRERKLAEAPELLYTSAAEILYLIDSLERPRSGAAQ